MIKCEIVMTDDKIIKLTFENKKDFHFDIKSNSIDVSDLILYISNFDKKIEIDNSQIKQLYDDGKLKVDERNSISFIEKVCDSFNESYDQVFIE